MSEDRNFKGFLIYRCKLEAARYVSYTIRSKGYGMLPRLAKAHGTQVYSDAVYSDASVSSFISTRVQACARAVTAYFTKEEECAYLPGEKDFNFIHKPMVPGQKYVVRVRRCEKNRTALLRFVHTRVKDPFDWAL